MTRWWAIMESVTLKTPSFAKASEDTPSSTSLPVAESHPSLKLWVACHPKLAERRVVGDHGIEPWTSTLSVSRSNQLS